MLPNPKYFLIFLSEIYFWNKNRRTFEGPRFPLHLCRVVPSLPISSFPVLDNNAAKFPSIEHDLNEVPQGIWVFGFSHLPPSDPSELSCNFLHENQAGFSYNERKLAMASVSS